MHTRKSALSVILVLVTLLTWTIQARATSGMPNSPEFGYGARLDSSSSNLDMAIGLASRIGMDWISVDFDWARSWPDPTSQPDFTEYHRAVTAAASNHLSVMVSINNAPPWMLGPQGPNPDLVGQLAQALAKSSPNTVQAIELFPGANTVRGWGSTPNPQNYLAMINTAQRYLAAINSRVVVLASLTPVQATQPAGDILDLEFLSALYQLNSQDSLPIIGIRYPEIHGDPLSFAQPGEYRFLRHYEQVRAVMLKYNRSKDLIWITGFSWPDEIKAPNDQGMWVYNAYKLMKAQLYIGSAFFTGLNPCTLSPANATTPSLVQPDLSEHPACKFISQIANGTEISVTPGQNSTQSIQASRPSGLSGIRSLLTKFILQKLNFKKLPPP